jgi:hypothetical protein
MRSKISIKHLVGTIIACSFFVIGHAQQWVGLQNPNIGNQVLVTEYDNGFATCGITLKNNVLQYRIYGYNGLLWQPIKTFFLDTASRIYAFEYYEGDFYLGGKINRLNGRVSSGDLIRLDMESGQFDEIADNSGSNDIILALTKHQRKLVIGGNFKSLGTGSTSFLTAYDGANYSAVTADVQAVPNGIVQSFLSYRDTLLVSGSFTKVQNTEVSGLVKITTGGITSIPNASDMVVRKMILHKGKVYGLGISRDIPRRNAAVSITDSTREINLNGVQVTSITDLASYKNRLFLVGKFQVSPQSLTAYLIQILNTSVQHSAADDNIKTLLHLHNIRGALFATGVVSGFRSDISQIARYEESGGIVSGRVYADINSDCNKQLMEFGLRNVLIRATPGPYYTSTDSNGFYAMFLPSGQYKLEALPLRIWQVTSCPENSKDIDLEKQNLYRGENFALDFSRKQRDVRVFLTSNSGWKARQGYRQVYRMRLENIGNSNVSSGIVTLKYPSALKDGLLFSIAPDAQNDSTASWNYEDLDVLGTKFWNFSILLPENYEGKKIDLTAEVQAVSAQEETADNTSSLSQEIDEGSFLNEKQIYPLPDPIEGITYINQEETSELIYTINFANFSEDTIRNVFVVDTLDPGLNIALVQEIGASHPYSTQVINGPIGSDINTLVWSFRDINLVPNPTQAKDKLGYSGYISFRVELSQNLPIGTQVKNQASLVFDYYHGWQTNAVVAEVSDFVDVATPPGKLKQLRIYPNPAHNLVTIDSEEDLENIYFFDASGKALHVPIRWSPKSVQLDISGLAHGVYVLRIETSLGISAHKVVVGEQ